MKKILILTASTGGGHNSVAKTLKNLFDDSLEVRIIDFLKEQSRILDMMVAEGYDVLAKKFPVIYARMYKMSNFEMNDNKFSNMIVTMIYKRVRQIIKEYNPDLVVGCHAFSVPIMTSLKQRGYYNKKFITVITDFNAHYAYVGQGVDYYITGSKYTRYTLIEKGIDPNKIRCYGIPISPIFYDKHNVERSEKFTVLVMGGSMGVDYMEDTIDELLKINANIKFMIVCGNNKSLENRLKTQLEQNLFNAEVEVYGFVDNIYVLMEMADLAVTKPGGLTATESIVKNLPMVVPYYIPGQEEENLEYLTLANMAIAVRDIKKIDMTILFLINNKYRLNQMRSSMMNVSKEYSLDSIKNLMLTALEEGEI